MYVELANGNTIKCDRIFGGPRIIDGIERDVLSIEITPEDLNLDDIAAKFTDENALTTIYYKEDIDPLTTKKEIGQGYMMFLGSRVENRKIKKPPGSLLPTEYEDLFIITLAQFTYEEYNQWEYRRNHPEEFEDE